jgi:5-methylcytosine-specific restriction protein B
VSAKLDLDTTFALIRAHAREGCYLSFGQVAAAQNVPWPQVRRSISDHLRSVCALSLSQGGPLVSSIVVNRLHVGTGHMEPETLAGFLAAARALGFTLANGEAFLREQQAATFTWAV